jgi:hypothetical protein
MEENYNQNQTQFSIEEPILETPQPEIDPTAVQPKKKTKPIVYIIIGVVVLLITIIILAALNRPEEVVEELTIEEPTPTLVQELSPIEKKLQVAVDKLEKANPTTEQYPFPPVDMELRIDDAK